MLQGHPRPWPVAKLRTLRVPAHKVHARIKGEGKEDRHPSPHRFLPAAACSTAAGRPGAKGRVSVTARHTTFVPVPPRYGSAVIQPGRYSFRPLPGRIPPEAFRAPRKQPFRLLAQRMPGILRKKRQSRLSALPARIPRCPSSTPPEAPHQRCCRCASIRRSVPVREDRSTPHHRHHALTPLGRPGPGAVGRLPSAQAAGLCRRLGA